MAKRAIVLVLDGCGAGAAPDQSQFDPAGEKPDTLRHVCAEGLEAPSLQNTGYLASAGLEPAGVEGYQIQYARLEPVSKGGKDSVTGHWEMMGIEMAEPFPTYPNGFPAEILAPFTAQYGHILGNKPASGTAIIAELGAEHVRTGQPIVYTSADSVLQIACHEEIISIERLYEMCRFARQNSPVQRVIARPFIGQEAGGFTRTDRRKDFPLDPPQNLVDEIGEVFGIGVVPELFGGRGFRAVKRTQNNEEHWGMLDEALNSDARFIFANFEDFDMRFGHRNDAPGFKQCLEEFSGRLQPLFARLKDEDLLILTADHGNDPTTPSTDHNREYVPFVAMRKGEGIRTLGDIRGFAEVGRYVRDHLA